MENRSESTMFPNWAEIVSLDRLDIQKVHENADKWYNRRREIPVG